VNKFADRRANAVAIISPDPLLGALIGAAVELLGYRAAFPRAGETPTETLRREKPAYVLIDCEDPNASDETLLGRGLMAGARLFFFGREARVEALRGVATRYNIEPIVFPGDVDSLHEILSRRIPRAERRPSNEERT
jgi:DNA-binding NtrC family response regulator